MPSNWVPNSGFLWTSSSNTWPLVASVASFAELRHNFDHKLQRGWLVMKDYVLFMHSDTVRKETAEEWSAYFAKLRASGQFQGGSAMGGGECLNKSGPAGPLHSVLTGYIRITANSLSEAKAFVEGNPTFEAGGTVEVRELPRS